MENDDITEQLENDLSYFSKTRSSSCLLNGDFKESNLFNILEHEDTYVGLQDKNQVTHVTDII